MPETKMMIALRDKTSTGTAKRYIVGSRHTNISGALYLDPSMEVPSSLVITFKEKKEDDNGSSN